MAPDIDLMGSVYCTQAVLPAMLESKWGRIINIASTAGVTGYAYVTTYCAAKHGMIGLTRALAIETARTGVDGKRRVSRVRRHRNDLSDHREHHQENWPQPRGCARKPGYAQSPGASHSTV